MENLSSKEQQLIAIVRDLRPFETVEIKWNDRGEIVFIYTKKEKYVFLTKENA